MHRQALDDYHGKLTTGWGSCNLPVESNGKPPFFFQKGKWLSIANRLSLVQLRNSAGEDVQSAGILKCFVMWEMSNSGRYEAILYACVVAFRDASIIFTGFYFVRSSEKQAFLQAVFFFFSPSAGRLWASSHVDAASHPYRVTLGSGLASVSWRRTKCLACVQEAWCGANCPSKVRRSTVGPHCVRTFCVWLFFLPLRHSSVCMCGKMNALYWCSQDVKSLLFFFLSSLNFEIQLPVQLGCGSIVNFWRVCRDQ